MASVDPADQRPATSFSQRAQDRGFKQRTIDALLKEDYDSVEVLVTINDSDLDALDITRGQRGLLKKWVSELRGSSELKHRPPDVKQITPTANPKQYKAQTLKPTKAPHSKQHLRMPSLPAVLVPKRPPDEPDLSDSESPPTADRQRGDGEDSDDIEPKHDEDTERKRSSDLIITDLNIVDCLKELQLGDESAKEVRKHVLEKGVDGLDVCLKDKLADFMKCPVSIAVIGRSGTGKSSLINSLRNLSAKDPGAASVGSVETTMDITPYPFPQMDHTRLWDVPGVNTPNFPKETYMEKVQFKNYDGVIIVSTERFTEDDLWLAKEAHDLKKPFYFLRTKIDIDITNNRRDGCGDDQMLMYKIRKQIQEKLHEFSLPNDRVFLVSNILAHQSKWDYPEFIADLLSNTPQRNKYAMVLAMVSCSQDVIVMKKKELRNRIDMVVLGALVKGKQYDKVIRDEIRLYTERLGITRTDLDKINTDGFDERITDIVQTLDDILNKPIEECTTARRIGIWFFGIGYFIGKWIDSERNKARHRSVKIRRDEVVQEARTILTMVLDQCEQLAFAVLDAKQYL